MNQPATGLRADAGLLHQKGPLGNRWWVYQRERFPLAAHGPLIAAFSLAAVGYSALTRESAGLPGWRQTLVAFATSLLFFLQLRLADEFKDFEEDSRHRPYRPVPRGLVKLRELSFVWIACIVLQAALAVFLTARLLPFLVATWAYLLLMTKEFFVQAWLKRHVGVYMLTHMVITPLIFLYASACDWMLAGYARPPRSLIWILAVNYFNGMVVEIGRKIRAPGDEEHGVETYSRIWGRRNAISAWIAAILTTNVFAYFAAGAIQHARLVSTLLSPILLLSVAAGIWFLSDRKPGRGKAVETVSGIWALMVYLSLGVIPVLLRWYGHQT
jgi:4-hydroxybenzoate polyprenyltransferase